MSSIVRKYTSSRIVLVALPKYVLEQTKMEYGSIKPMGLSQEWKIFIDSEAINIIICGSELQNQNFYCLVNVYLNYLMLNYEII